MNKRKTLALALTLCMVAILAIGGSLAYFTDTDEETNTFTLGNVKIDLKETFDKEHAVLRPGSQTTNKIEKKVWIENVGTESAYVWYEWYIPTALDSTDGSTGTNNVLHVNSNGNSWDKYRENSNFWTEGQTEALPLEQTWDHDPENELGLKPGPEGYIRQETIGGIQYNVYLVLYRGVLAAGKETTVAMNGAYLDSKVDNAVDADGNVYYTINGKKIDYDFSENINIIVKAYGIQAAGFKDVYAAYNAYQAQK